MNFKNEWYITRCACCGLKLKAVNQNQDIKPYHNYCTNCGCSEYVVEKLDKINFIDINFAVLMKKVVEESQRVDITQYWQEKRFEQPKLLGLYQ